MNAFYFSSASFPSPAPATQERMETWKVNEGEGDQGHQRQLMGPLR